MLRSTFAATIVVYIAFHQILQLLCEVVDHLVLFEHLLQML